MNLKAEPKVVNTNSTPLLTPEERKSLRQRGLSGKEMEDAFLLGKSKLLARSRDEVKSGVYFNFFSEGQPLIQVLQAIYSARSSIDIDMFSFTCQEILDDLHRAVDRRVKVRILLDKKQWTLNKVMFSGSTKDCTNINSVSEKFVNNEATGELRVSHEKFIIVDNEIVLFGSFNFTNRAAYYNYETLVVRSESNTLREFSEYFTFRWLENDDSDDCIVLIDSIKENCFRRSKSLLNIKH